MTIRFDPSQNLWIDTETGLTGATQEDLRITLLNERGGLVSAKSRSFAPLTRAYAAFSSRGKSGADFRGTPNLDFRFGGRNPNPEG